MEEVRNWLRGLGLEQYAPRFEEDGWDSLEILQHMRSSDIEACIDKAGHRRKFEIGIETHFPKRKDKGDTENTRVEECTVNSNEIEGDIVTAVNHRSNTKEMHKNETEEMINKPDNLKVLQSYKGDVGEFRNNETDAPRTVLSDLNTDVPIAKEVRRSDTQYEDFDATERESDLTCTKQDHVDQTTLNGRTYHGVKARGKHRLDNEESVYGGILDTVCVKGARNKILMPALPTDSSSLARRIEGQRTGNKSQTIAKGFLAVKEQITRTNPDVDVFSCDSSSNSASDSENEDIKTMANIEETQAGQHLIAGTSTQPITKATIVSDSKNVTIAHRAEVHHHHHKPTKKATRDNFKDQIANVVEGYKRKDHLFVETNALREVEDIINDRYWALITGKPGDGKSSMAAHLMLKYKQNGFESIILTNAQDWKEMVKGESSDNKTDKQFVMIDDMFGSMSVDDKKVNEWVSMMEVIQSVIKERKGSLVVVCTSRAHVFYDIKAKFEKFSCFQSTSCVDMTQPMHILTAGEKIHIWQKYTKEYNVTSSAPQCIFDSVISPHGFPHCVELFCSNRFLREQGVAFFENPMQYICREIQNFKENDKIKYCLLLLILFNRNKLEEGVLQQICSSDPPKEVIKIFKAAGLSSDYAQSELKKALCSLRNTYVYEELDNTYRFSHESIRENVAFMYIKDNPLHAIEEIDLKYLVDHTRCHGYTSGRQEKIFILPSFSTNALVERMVKEIERGHIEIVCQHQAWADHVFMGKFVDYVLRRFTENTRRAESLQNLLFKRQIQSRWVWLWSIAGNMKLNFLEMLINFQHKTALTYLLRNMEIKTLIQSQESIKSLSYALVFACFFMPETNIISLLLQMGADINIVLSKEEVDFYATFYIPNRTTYEIYNPLLCAVFKENASLVTLLMDKGGSVFIGEEPVALIAAVELNLPDVLKIILEKTAHSILVRGESVERNNCHGYSKHADETTVAVWNCKFSRFVLPLNRFCVLSLVHLANSAETLQELVKKGVMINEDVIVSGTRMPHCIYRMLVGLEAKCFKELLQLGMNATGTWMESSCLHYCVINLSGIEFTGSSGRGISLRDSEGTHRAKIQPYCDLLLHLISSHSLNNSLNQVDRFGNSALHYLLQVQMTEEYIIVPEIRRAMFNEMVRLGSDINLKNKTGITPVMNALSHCTDIEILRVCIDRRTAMMVDESGRGYFHHLAESTLPRDKVLEIVQMLLESGEDINQKDKTGNIPGFHCHYESLSAFSMAGACLDIVNNSEQNIMFANLKKVFNEERCDIFDIIRNISPDINTTDMFGQSPMHCLMSSHADEFYRFKLIYDALFEAGCDPVKADKYGVTPLMLAGENPTYNEDFFAFLIDQELNFSGTDSCDKSVLHHLLSSSTDEFTKQDNMHYLLYHFPNLFDAGCDILSYACNEMACSINTALELLKYKYKRNKESDYSHEIIELLMSNRSLNEKCFCLEHLFHETQIRLPFRKILLSDTLSEGIKEYVTRVFVNDTIGRLEELVYKEDDLYKILSGLSDDSVLKALKQIENSVRLKGILSSLHLSMTLCKHNFTKSLKFLLNVRSNLSKQDDNGNTIIHNMIEYITDDDSLADLVNITIERKADISQPNKELMTALHVACKARPLRQKTTYLLIEHMDHVDQQDRWKTMALHYLCSNQKKRVCKAGDKFDVQLYLALCLICKGADVDHQNTKGQTVIMSAIHERLQHESLITLLIENSKDLNKQDVYGNTVLHHIARSSVHDDIKALIIELIMKRGGDMRRPNQDNESCIDVYTKLLGHKSVGSHVFALLLPFVDIGCENEILDILFSSLTVFFDERKESLEKMKDIVIKRQININNVHTVDGRTLMMAASESLLPDAMRALLTLNANTNVRDMVGCTCLTRLLWSLKVKYMSVLHTCYVGKNLYKEFDLQVGSFFWNDVDTSKFLEAVAQTEISYSVGDRDCLRIVKQLNKKALDVLQTVLSAGADPNILDISGKSALHHYVQSPLADIFICPAIEMLLDFGAKVNNEDFEGMTPLMACSQFSGRKSKRLNILIAAGANIRAVDNQGQDAVEYGKLAFCRMKNIHRK